MDKPHKCIRCGCDMPNSDEMCVPCEIEQERSYWTEQDRIAEERELLFGDDSGPDWGPVPGVGSMDWVR